MNDQTKETQDAPVFSWIIMHDTSTKDLSEMVNEVNLETLKFAFKNALPEAQAKVLDSLTLGLKRKILEFDLNSEDSEDAVSFADESLAQMKIKQILFRKIVDRAEASAKDTTDSLNVKPE